MSIVRRAARRSALLLAVLLIAGPLQAAPIPVNTTDEEFNVDGDCSLREAIVAANTDAAVDACPAGAGADDISLPAGAYELWIGADGTPDDSQDGDLDIATNMTITGAGAALTVIQGAGADGILEINGLPTVEISGVTISGGLEWAGGPGAGIDNSGSLTLRGVIVENNLCLGGAGGGIYTTNNLTVVDSSVLNNISANGAGGIHNTGGGTVTLINSTVAGNTTPASGGGIQSNGTLNLTDTVIDDNESGLSGGGIDNTGGGTLTATRCSITNNESVASSGGGLWSNGTLTMTDSTVSGNTAHDDGGGFENTGGGTLNLTNCTVSGNRTGSGDGGGIHNTGASTISLTNCTMASNSAADEGGGIHIVNGTVNVQNTIITNNTTGGDCAGGGAATSLGTNIDSDNTCGFGAAGDQPNTNALLSPLASNGGSTQTHNLLPGSPAIDLGNNAASPAADQRGVARPQDANGDGVARSDIGAVEHFVDCNSNGLHDAADVGNGVSADCDGNRIPDECQPGDDGNGNAVPDVCDANIAAPAAAPAPCGCGATSAVAMAFWALCAARLARRRRS